MRARRRLGALAAFGAAAALAAAAPVTAAVGQTGPASVPVSERAYTIVAEAFPVEPAPGSQNQPVAIRPLASRVSLANPPASAYARAAATDLGLAEGYVGQQGPSAEADTATEGGAPTQDVAEGGTVLHAAVTDAPHGEATAEGAAGGVVGSGSSSAAGDGGAGVLVAEAQAEVHDYAIGPLVIGSGRFEARVSTDGTPGGATGVGTILVSDTTVGGIPVVIDADGVRVDTTTVPLAQLAPLAAAVQSFMAQGGYSDVRVVQPRVEVAEDGSSAEVSGGGVRFYGTNNDPTNLYFVSVTVLGGRAAVDVGSAFAGAGLDRPSDAGPAAAIDAATPASSRPAGTNATPAAPAASTEAAAPVALDYDEARRTVELRGIWTGWPWVLLGAALLLAGSSASLRVPAVRARADALLDGYGRG